MFQKRQVILIPTNQKAKKDDLCLNSSYLPNLTQPLVRGFDAQIGTPNGHLKPQHLYILSDEKICKGNWMYDRSRNVVEQLNDGVTLAILEHDPDRFKKIIATTDPSLTFNTKCNVIERKINKLPLGSENVNKLPSIPQSFIEKYISEYNKGNKIKEAMVEYEEISGDCDRLYCKKHGMIMCSGLLKSDLLSDIMNPEKLDIDKLDEYEHTCGHKENQFVLKINSDNTINIKSIKDTWTNDEMYLNMQYYYEYCVLKGYVTPQDWMENYKHF